MGKFLDERQNRVSSIKKALSTMKEVERGKFIALTAINFGCTQRKIEEYVNMLEDAGYIKENMGILEWID